LISVIFFSSSTEVGEYCIVRSYVKSCSSPNRARIVKDDEMGMACSMHGEKRNDVYRIFFVGKLERKTTLGKM
jgi:hypothetical protein